MGSEVIYHHVMRLGSKRLSAYMYSTDQIQGITRLRFDRALNAFIAKLKRVHR